MGRQFLSFNAPAGNQAYANCFGIDAVVGPAAIQVTALGGYVDPSVPWASAKQFTVFNTSTGAVLAQLTISPADVSGGVATPSGGALMKALSAPVTIPANTPISICSNGYGTEEFWYSDANSAYTSDLGSGLIGLTGHGRTGSDQVSLPATVNPAGFGPVPYDGPTMAYQAAGGSPPSPSLTLSPGSATATAGGSPVAQVATLANSSAALLAAVDKTGGGTAAGTLSTASPTSGTPFNYLPPTTATGPWSDTITVSDATDTLSATAVITGSPATPVPGINIVWHGTSLTYGTNSSAPGGTSTARVAAVLAGLGPAAQGVNHGVSGATLTQMIAAIPGTITPLYDATKAANILMVEGGHNDYYDGGSFTITSAQVEALITSYCSAALAAHPWLIVWSMEPPAANPAYPPNFDALRDASNAWLATHWRSLGIASLACGPRPRFEDRPRRMRAESDLFQRVGQDAHDGCRLLDLGRI